MYQRYLCERPVFTSASTGGTYRRASEVQADRTYARLRQDCAVKARDTANIRTPGVPTLIDLLALMVVTSPHHILP